MGLVLITVCNPGLMITTTFVKHQILAEIIHSIHKQKAFFLCYHKSTRWPCEMANWSEKAFRGTKMFDSVHTRSCRVGDSPFYGSLTSSTKFGGSWPLESQAEIIIIISRNPIIRSFKDLYKCKCAFCHKVIPRASWPEDHCHQVTSLEGGVLGNISTAIPKIDTTGSCVHHNWCQKAYLLIQKIWGLWPRFHGLIGDESTGEFLELLNVGT